VKRNELEAGFNIILRIKSGEKKFISGISKEDFIYEVLDMDVRVEIQGHPVFQVGDHRVSNDSFAQEIPIIVFLGHLLSKCRQLSAQDPSRETVYITSSQFWLEFLRTGDRVTVRVLEDKRGNLCPIAETIVSLREVQDACKSSAESALAEVVNANLELADEISMKRFSQSIEALKKQIGGGPFVDDKTLVSW
jgi:hypothetical protein